MKRVWIVAAPLVLTGCLLSGCTDPDAPAPGSPGTAASTAGGTASRPGTLPPENPAPGDHTAALLLPDGTRRDYLVHAPPRYAPGTAYPLVLVFHGSPGTAAEMPERTTMNDVADAHGFLVVYPDQFEDVGSVAALLDHLVPRWGVDARRVHAAGFSRGATLTYELAYRLADRFGSVALVSGVAPEAGVEPPARPVSLLTFQGGLDRLAQAFPGTNAGWDRAADCRDERTTSITMGGGPTHIYTTTCAGGAEHVTYSVTRMGHEWPAEASGLIWNFFQRHLRS